MHKLVWEEGSDRTPADAECGYLEPLRGGKQRKEVPVVGEGRGKKAARGKKEHGAPKRSIYVPHTLVSSPESLKSLPLDGLQTTALSRCSRAASGLWAAHRFATVSNSSGAMPSAIM